MSKDEAYDLNIRLMTIPFKTSTRPQYQQTKDLFYPFHLK